MFLPQREKSLIHRNYTLDRLQQDAAKLLEEYETAKLDGTEEEAAKLDEAYERVLAEINAMLG